MAFEIPKVKYSGKINEVVLGASQTLTVGGETSYPFLSFEGEMPNKPKIAMEVWDYDPSEIWPEAVLAPFEGVLGDPGAWAKKCVEYGADIIAVKLKSTDPNDQDNGPDHAVAAVKAVLAAVDVPVIVYGVSNKEKDIETLSAVAETFQGKNLILGPVEEHNHKQIGAQALAYGHIIAGNTPIDVNLAKQLNILLGNLGVTNEKILIDPTTGGLGYGMEYCYSVIERIRMAALVQQDDNLQQPIINDMSQEVWKCKEAGIPIDEEPTLGYPDDRGILMEVTEAVALTLAGSNVLIMRHPEAVKLIKQYIDLMVDGGELAADGFKDVQMVGLDKLPKVEFTPAEPPKKEKKAAPVKKAAPKAEAKPAAKPKKEAAPAKPEAAKVVPIKEAKKKPEPEPKAVPAPAEIKVDEQAQKQAEAEAKAKAEAEAQEKAAKEAKEKAEAEARRKAEEEARQQAAAEAKEKERIAEEEKLRVLRAQRAKEREELEARRLAEEEGPREMKKAEIVIQPEYVVAERIMASLQRVHIRNRK